MKTIKYSYLLASSLVLIASMCSGPSDDTAPDRSALKIILVDSLSTKNDDEAERLPDNIRELCAVLTSDSKSCNHTYILDPVLLRLDLSKEFSLKTTIEKGGAKNISNPKVIGKLIQKNFDELELPKLFAKKQPINKNSINLITGFITTKSTKDSIIVYSEDGEIDKFLLNNKPYKAFTSIEDIRNRILSILCENPKANFTLLMNPPALSNIPKLTLKVSNMDCQTGKLTVTAVGGDGSPITYAAQGLSAGQSSSEFMIEKNKRSNKFLTFSAIQNGIISKVDYTTNCPLGNGRSKGPKIRTVNAGNGDLTMIKGSEGCDICTRYYSATDNLGRTQHITEQNSTYCCPCGKTIEMKGRTYRMECDGTRSNRLALIQ